MKNMFLFSIILMVFMFQIFLSLRKNKWAGMVIPILNLIFAIILLLGSIGGAEVFFIFIYTIIPFTLNLTIYLICRNRIKVRNNDEITKMNIQDL